MTSVQQEHVSVIEVGPRDGLQNESRVVPTATKLALIERLIASGLQEIEITSFVRPDRVPQLADAAQIVAGVAQIGAHTSDVRFPVLVPNMRGYERARECGVTSIALFVGASETFNQRNVNASIADTLARFVPVVAAARADDVAVRGYVSTAFGCPFEGDVAAAQVVDLVARLCAIGIDDISLGDTIGVAVPRQIHEVCAAVAQHAEITPQRLALHLHDTRGTALANVAAGLAEGIRCFDASVAGLGGCPFAPGASGNLATEDLVWFLHRQGYETEIDLATLIETSRWIAHTIGRPIAGHIGTAPLVPASPSLRI